MIASALAALMAVSSVSQAGELNRSAVIAQQREIIAAQKEIASLQEQLKGLRTKRNIQIGVAVTSAVATIAGAAFAALGSYFFGYDGRRIMLSEKIGMGAMVATPAALAATTGAFAYLNSNEIDKLLEKLEELQLKLNASESAMENLLQD